MSEYAPEKKETDREALRSALREGLRTAHELSALAGVRERDVVSHLEHIERAARSRGEKFVLEPARCDDCDFAFKKRDRLGRPSRCPVCRSGRLSGPRFALE